MKRLLLCLTPTLSLLAACGNTYRYPCQDPAKAPLAECQCGLAPRTKNKALNAVEPVTTSTIPLLVGFDC